MKRILSILLVIGMSIPLIAGCGKNENTETADTAQAQAGEAVENDADKAAEAADGSAADAAAGDAAADTEAVADTEAAASPLGTSISMPLNKYSKEWDCPYAGFTFTVPDEIRESKGQFFPTDGGETGAGSGVYVGFIHYLARSDEEQIAFDEYVGQIATMESIDEQTRTEYDAKAAEFYEGRNAVVLVIMAVRNDQNLGDVLTDQFSSVPIAASGEIGSADNYNFYYIVPDYSDEAEDLAAAMTEEFYAEFSSAMDNAEDLVPYINVKIPWQSESVDEGTKLSFETTDLDGNPVTSEELFADHKVTMINLWATWCGPCVNELAELEELNKEFAEKGCQIIGICTDAKAGGKAVDTAKSILAEKGVTYTNLMATDEILSAFSLMAYPTSYFVDSEGRILTEPVVGADFAQYKAAMEKALEAQ